MLVIGDAGLDIYINGKTERVCREAPVPVIDIETSQATLGCAANCAVNVAALGAETFTLFVIGDDPEGKQLISYLKSHHINTDHLLVDHNRTTLAKKRVESHHHMIARLDTGTIEPISQVTENKLIERLEKLYSQMDVVIISDYGKGLVTDKIRKTIKVLQKKYKKILVADAKNLELYRDIGITLVKPNYDEATQLIGCTGQSENRMIQITSQQDVLKEKTGAQIIAVTLDTEGSLIFTDRSEPYRTYSQPFNHSRSVGAGDTYIAAFALSLAAHAPVHASAHIAQLASLVVLAKDGTNTCTQIELQLQSMQNGKIIPDQNVLRNLVATLKKQNKRIVFTNGCFDILHRGHVTYLSQAKALGDILILGLNSDSSVRRLKGPERPINTGEDRAAVLSGLGSVDFIIEFHENTPVELIKIINPDIYVKGGDYTRESLPETPFVEKAGGKVEIIPFVMDRSTTNIIKKIRQTTTPSHITFQGMKHGRKTSKRI